MQQGRQQVDMSQLYLRRDDGTLASSCGNVVRQCCCTTILRRSSSRTTLRKVVCRRLNSACILSPPCSPRRPRPTPKRRIDGTTWHSRRCNFGVMCPREHCTISLRAVDMKNFILASSSNKVSAFTAPLEEKIWWQSA